MNKWFLSLLPLGLLACHPGPVYTPPPQRMPEKYEAADGQSLLPSHGQNHLPSHGQGRLPSRWWEALGDAPLNGLIQQALAQSPDLRMAEARFRQSRALQGIQEAAGGPQLGLGAQVTRDRLSANSEMLANLPFKNVNTQFTNHQIAFDASWEIDLFGHTRRLAEAAQARSEASAERLRDAGLVLSAEVARHYIDYRLWQRRLALGLESQAAHRELARLMALQGQAGEASLLDVQRVEASRRVQEAGLSDLRLGARQSLAALSILTDLPLADLETRLGEAPESMALPPAPEPGLPSELLKRRPDVRVAERELAAASADVGVAIADQYPRFSLVGVGGWTSIQSGTLLTQASRTWSVGPQIHLPLFQSGRLKNQVKAQEAAYETASAAYRKAVLTALADVEVALMRLAQSEERRQQLLAATALQRRQVALTELQLKAGDVSKIPLLEARKNLLGQEDQTLQAQAQSLSALVSLCKALGGGWEG